jgi:hypothetical protein
LREGLLVAALSERLRVAQFRRRTAAANAGEQDTSLLWRETADEDVCLAVACGCWLSASCQRRLAFGF